MEYKNKLAFVAIIKNEVPYIREWILFHKMVGVDKFYIYDNDSIDNLYDEIKDFIDAGLVEYIKFPGMALQNLAYTIAAHKYKRECKYMGFIDCDEFVHPVNCDNLCDILDQTIGENIGGIAINWRMYGSNHLYNKPDGLVIENYVLRAKDDFEPNKHIKTICNPRTIFLFKNPHYPIYKKGYYSVSENGDKVEGPFNVGGTVNRMRINHYFTKSKEEYIKKMNRGKADSFEKRNIIEFYEHDRNDVYDFNLAKYVDPIKEELEKNKKI